MRQQKCLIFDFDGTIADTFNEVVDLLLTNSKNWGLPELSRDELDVFRNMKSQEAIRQLGIPLYKIPWMVLKIRQGLHKRLKVIKPIKDITEVLEWLSEKGYSLGILTSNSKKNVEQFLTMNKIKCFGFIYSNYNLWGKGKSLSKMFRELKIDPKSVIYIGDETRDVEAAKAVGVCSAAVTWGFQGRGILESLKPDYVFNSPSDLLKL